MCSCSRPDLGKPIFKENYNMHKAVSPCSEFSREYGTHAAFRGSRPRKKSILPSGCASAGAGWAHGAACVGAAAGGVGDGAGSTGGRGGRGDDCANGEGGRGEGGGSES